MNWRFIDWIWHVRGALALPPGQSSDEVFARLAPLFSPTGTSHDRAGDRLTFRKKDPAAQDKMSVFDGGVLQVEKAAAGSVLRYHLTSRALLFCFLLPLLFLGFAQLTITLNRLQTPSADAKSGKDAASQKPAAKKKAEVPMNPLDKALGAPPPEKPKKDGKGDADDDKRPTPTSAYIFAGIFAALYFVGRILEARLVNRLFRNRLLGA